MGNPRTFTVGEVAEMVDRSDETVRRWIRNGYLSAVRIGREYRISVADLNDFWRQRGGKALVYPSGDAFPDDVDLDAPQRLEDLRDLAERVELRAAELREAAATLEKWSADITQAVDDYQEVGGDEEPSEAEQESREVDLLTEKLFDEEGGEA